MNFLSMSSYTLHMNSFLMSCLELISEKSSTDMQQLVFTNAPMFFFADSFLTIHWKEKTNRSMDSLKKGTYFHI